MGEQGRCLGMRKQLDETGKVDEAALAMGQDQEMGVKERRGEEAMTQQGDRGLSGKHSSSLPGRKKELQSGANTGVKSFVFSSPAGRRGDLEQAGKHQNSPTLADRRSVSKSATTRVFTTDSFPHRSL
ncbi:hypothetical protein D4764_0263760 [Takifugu flavidus]|uniref:Uncharacterized protein n=1 Tax=Takifugu flavidus TaxID=433684 RepID=A0A5C6ME14_9TELE|nr:hypothetical protein D4764_0263760 [Takifugu flavidus]